MDIFHGVTQTELKRLRWVYYDMNRRCKSPSHKGFVNYGGRGIKVCRRWQQSFFNWLQDMGLRPDRSFTLERVDNSKGYNPSNCKWATRAEQALNKRMYKSNNTGFRNILKRPDNGKYRVRIRRNGKIVFDVTVEKLEKAVQLRDEWLASNNGGAL